jgi:hypothetical protein
MANTKITTNVIADDAITSAKIADDAVGNDQLASGLTFGSEVTVNTDANSSLTIKDGGTDAIQILAASGDELYIGSNNAYKLRLKTDGNIVMDNGGSFGIGNSNPTAILTIDNSIATTYSTSGYGGTTANSMLYLNNTHGGSNTASLINFRTGTGDGVIGFVEGGGTNDADFVIQTDGGSNGVERFRISNTGNVGIGTASPAELLHLKGGTGNDSAEAPIIRIQKHSGGAVDDGQTIGGMSFWVNDDGVDSGAPKERAKIIAESQNTSSATRLEFWTSNSNEALAERMRIIGDGKVLYGATGFGYNGGQDAVMIDGVSEGRIDIENNTTSTQYVISFYNPNGNIGKITTSGSSTNYATSSDYRLKENVDYTWDATTRLKQLKPARFNFIADETNTLIDGFLAHEVSSIVPEAITGEKDGTEMQSIDQSKLVPLLVKTIQELEARITTLEG